MQLLKEYDQLITYNAGDFVSRVDLQDRLFEFIYTVGYTSITRRGCRDCIGRAYAALKRTKRELIENYQKNTDTMADKKYIFKKGHMYRPHNWDKVLTHENCTQEDAKKLLSQNPKLIHYFEVVEIPAPKKEEAETTDGETEKKPKRKRSRKK